jgi:hypothetical protein
MRVVAREAVVGVAKLVQSQGKRVCEYSHSAGDFLLSLLALAHFMRLSLMKAARAGVGGAPSRKSGYVGRK